MWLIVLWCIGLASGLGFTYIAHQPHYMTIQTLISSDYSFAANLIITLSFLVLPYVLIRCDVPCCSLICLLSFLKGFTTGFFFFVCLLLSAKCGWILCVLLQFSALITIVPIMDYWIKCLSTESENIRSLLLCRCLLFVSILLFDRFAIFPILVRLF